MAESTPEGLATEAAAIPSAKSYRGWIPAVSGRLSFSAFGRTLFPAKAVFANIADRQTRYLAIYQARHASDVILPFRRVLAPILFGIDGDIWFVLLARTVHSADRTQEYLAGRAFLFPNAGKWRKVVLPAVSQYQQHLRAFRFSAHASMSDYADEAFNDAIAKCTGWAGFHCDVRISRTGTTDVSVALPLSLPADAPTFPGDEVQRSHILHILAAQLFFFIKDIGHHHQHHDPRTDTIVDLYETTGRDDLEWRLSTLYAMYRKVIDYKRNPHISTFNNCLGIIAYATTFLSVCKSRSKKSGFMSNEMAWLSVGA